MAMSQPQQRRQAPPRGAARPAPQQQATTEKALEQRPNVNAPVPLTTLRDLLNRMAPQLGQALPATLRLDPQRFIRLLLTTVHRAPHLQACTARSILEAAMEAAALGLAIEPALGHAYLIPYKGQAKLLIGYRGLIALAHRSGKVSAVWAGVVYPRDKWHRTEGTDPTIVHEPQPPKKVKQEGGRIAIVEEEAIAYYACVKLLDGTVKSDWMWREDVEKVRLRSPTVQQGRPTPWDTDYDEMGKKTVIRRLCKTADLSPELTRAAVADEQRELGIDVEGVTLADYELPPDVAAAATDARREQLAQKYQGAGQTSGAPGAGTGQTSGADDGEPPPFTEEELAALDAKDAAGAAGGRVPGEEG